MKKYRQIQRTRVRNSERRYFKIMKGQFEMKQKSKQSEKFHKKQLLSKVLKFLKRQAMKNISIRNLLYNYLT